MHQMDFILFFNFNCFNFVMDFSYQINQIHFIGCYFKIDFNFIMYLIIYYQNLKISFIVIDYYLYYCFIINYYFNHCFIIHSYQIINYCFNHYFVS